jgi:hypothetical protein
MPYFISHFRVPAPWSGTTSRFVLLAVAWLAAAAIFFRGSLFTSWRMIAGDAGDGRFIIFINEHIFQSLMGRADFLSPPMFWPVPNTLGDSEAFLLYQVLYAPLRWLGLDPFRAYEITLILLSAIGFGFFVACLIRFGKVSPAIAAACAVCFLFSNALYLNAVHTQLYGVMLLPVIVFLALGAAEARCPSAIAQGAAAGILYALLFPTSYYIAWAFGIYLAFFGLAALAIGRAPLLQRAAARWPRWRSGMLAGASGFIVGLVPFFIIYRSAFLGEGGWNFAEVMTFAATPSDFLEMGNRNLLWGYLDTNDQNLGLWQSVTPSLLLTFTALAAIEYRKQWVFQRREPLARAFVLASFSAFAAVLLITLRYHSHSPFWLLWRVIPGGQAIRVAFRFQLVGALFVTSGLAVMLQALVARRSVTLCAVVLCICLVEQLNLASNANLDAQQEITRLAALPAPPRSCRSLFLLPASDANGSWVIDQMDAIAVAQHLHLPTENGYTGKYPDGWDMFDTRDGGYLERVAAWLGSHRLMDTSCAIDMESGRWMAAKEILPLRGAAEGRPQAMQSPKAK